MPATAAVLPRKHRLHRTVAAIAHPPLQAALERLVLDKGAKADALHAPVHGDVADRAHLVSPTSMTRAPVQRDVDQRSTERM